MKHFAQELIDIVINDAQQWTSCSLVCRAWLPATRRRLFSHVQLKMGSDSDHDSIYSHAESEHSRRFLEILDTESCTFGPFITHLFLGVHDKGEPRMFLTLAKLTAVVSLQFYGWQFRYGVEPILEWLPHLGRLSELTFKQVAFQSVNQLFSVLECCSLSALTITGSDVIGTPFETPESLLHLLEPDRFPPPQKAPPFPYTRSGSIQKLHLTSPEMAFLDIFTNSASSLNCSTVHLEGIETSKTKSIGVFLQQLGETLEHLKFGFEFYSYGEEFDSNVDLQYNTGLRSIYVMDMVYSAVMGHRFLKRLPSLLRQCASPHLTDITFSFYLEALPFIALFEWAALDEALMSIQVQLDSPGKLTFLFVDVQNNEVIVSNLLAIIQMCLPQSSAQFKTVILPGERPSRPLIGGGDE
ncbi:hypothetical protein C8R44DRAFT_881663 [Mycena epipterygia]|nr:hypothetical protein C8R44DRAFT_881663 [Mycena epipterygia]